jgi:hypothetical protein
MHATSCTPPLPARPPTTATATASASATHGPTPSPLPPPRSPLPRDAGRHLGRRHAHQQKRLSQKCGAPHRPGSKLQHVPDAARQQGGCIAVASEAVLSARQSLPRQPAGNKASLQQLAASCQLRPAAEHRACGRATCSWWASWRVCAAMACMRPHPLLLQASLSLHLPATPRPAGRQPLSIAAAEALPTVASPWDPGLTPFPAPICFIITRKPVAFPFLTPHAPTCFIVI